MRHTSGIYESKASAASAKPHHMYLHIYIRVYVYMYIRIFIHVNINTIFDLSNIGYACKIFLVSGKLIFYRDISFKRAPKFISQDTGTVRAPGEARPNAERRSQPFK